MLYMMKFNYNSIVRSIISKMVRFQKRKHGLSFVILFIPVYLSAQQISTCTYSFPGFACSMQFPCDAIIDSSDNRLIIQKEYKNSSGNLIAVVNWTIHRARVSEDVIFQQMVKAEQQFMRKQKMTMDESSKSEKPDSRWIACPDSIYCAQYKVDYYDDGMYNYTAYNYVNYSAKAIAFFRVVLKKRQGYSLDDFKNFRDRLSWHPNNPITAPNNKVTFQLPAGIFDAIENENGVYIFKMNVRDSLFLKKNTFLESDITSLEEYIRIKKHGFNTVAAITTLEKQFSDEQKKKGWDCYPAKKISLPGSTASEISMIKSFRSYKNQYGSWDNDSCAYYILAFQDSKVKKNIPANIRSIYVVYVPLREGSWLRSIEAATRERLLATIKPVYQ